MTRQFEKEKLRNDKNDTDSGKKDQLFKISFIKQSEPDSGRISIFSQIHVKNLIIQNGSVLLEECDP